MVAEGLADTRVLLLRVGTNTGLVLCFRDGAGDKRAVKEDVIFPHGSL